jgi:hypothetical protein
MSRAKMTREQWNTWAESVDLTDDQLGRIMAEWERLGLAGDEDRAERLTLTAAIALVDGLDSTHALTLGQAGRVINRLMHCDDLDELRAEHDLDDQAAGDLDDAEPVVTLCQALALAVAWLAFPEYREVIEHGWQQITAPE